MSQLFQGNEILIIEPFYGGSHKFLIDALTSHLPSGSYSLLTMSPKKWHWRARTSALYISRKLSKIHNFKVLFATSVVPLAELLGIRPDLANTYKILYFHENQLQFPVRVTKERDFQYGFNEIMSCLAADKILFNSKYNMNSFLGNIDKHLKIQPDFRVKDLSTEILPKCDVVYYPINLKKIDAYLATCDSIRNTDESALHIVWPHRWEFDKNPDAFCAVLTKLAENNLNFKVSILGESFSEKPEVFERISNMLGDRLQHCGYVEDIGTYYKLLHSADVVLSTAVHEFFGVAVMEAVYCDCIPVLPKRLAYRELYEDHVTTMYDTDDEMYDILRQLCNDKSKGQAFGSYKHLALPFESTKWIENLVEMMRSNCTVF